MYKNLSIRKRFEVKAPTHPTHDLVAINDEFNKESTVVVGSLWTKVAQDKNGVDYKFLSGRLNTTKILFILNLIYYLQGNWHTFSRREDLSYWFPIHLY